MSDLKPCPLCHGGAIACNTITEGYVRCRDCGANVVRRNLADEDGLKAAIAAWNTRAPATVKDPPMMVIDKDGTIRPLMPKVKLPQMYYSADSDNYDAKDVLDMLRAAGIEVEE